ncbi:sugar porter family MFS transporter [Sphingobacterium sp. SGR-19]|uniref:sugar porter family MFS transporter n=1 Tax=Sphingobacterium sp. SGR-19 TaxID=2710886 RepID=UPI0013EA7127|nr:sugar porter family MFS transporter [Sphingobacterium sp. SGR-19]NGM65466.1 sugar porter family MFS transporter [Sphingobacterium sp. SGR-19]
MNESVNLKYISFLAVVAAIGGFLFGYDTAVISGTIAQITVQFGLDTVSQGWYVGCALVGSILGVSCGGYLGDRFGRRMTLLLSALLFTVSAVYCALSTDFDQLVYARIIGGVGTGIVSIVSPMYISELSAPQYRGRLVSLYQLAVTVGFLGAYLVNYVLLNYALGDAQYLENTSLRLAFYDEVWRGMLGVASLPSVFFLVVLLFIPESPRWLILKGRLVRAKSVLSRIYRSATAAEAEVAKIGLTSSSNQKVNWKLLGNSGVRKAVWIGAAIAILGQFMGVNAVLYYGPTIFESSGLSGGDSLFYQVIVGLVNVLTTVLAVFIIDKVGRKKLVYLGVSGMIVFLLLISVYFVWGDSIGLPNIFMLVCFLAYVFCCAISISAVIWVLLSEMYPNSIRGLAMSIAGFSLWVGTYLIGQLTPWMLENLSPGGTFLLFAAMCIPYMLIVWKLVPETTGRSLEDIERHWIH